MGTNLDVANYNEQLFLGRLPTATVYQSTPQSIPNNTNTAIIFNSQNNDNWGGFSGTNPTRYTFQLSGVYMLDGAVSWAANATNRRYQYFRINGNNSTVVPGSIADLQSTSTNNMVVSTPTTLYPFNTGDYVELMANQNTGAALSTVATGATSAFISTMVIKWIHF